MLKKWKRSLLVTAVFGLAASSALAEKLSMAGLEIFGPPAQPLTMEPKPVAGAPASHGPVGSPGPSDGPILPSGTTEQLPMPAALPGAPIEEGPVFFDEDDNGVQQGVFFAEVGLHILRPVIGNNQALIGVSFDKGKMAATSTTSFSYDFSASPSILIGYETASGLSGSISWFRFDQFSRPRNVIENPLVDGTGTVFSTNGGLSAASIDAFGQTNLFDLSSYLLLDIWDLEVAQKFTLGQLQGSLGGGLRYLHMAQRFLGSVSQTGLPAGAINSAIESTGNSFSGIGPMILADVQRPIGFYNLSIYANARAGLLFGSRHESNLSANVFNPGGADTVVTTNPSTSLRTDQTVGFGEVELGLEWAGQFGRFYPFARLGFEGREFFNTGNSQSLFLSHTGDVGLYGVAIRFGTEY
jgi:hypothetical protein